MVEQLRMFTGNASNAPWALSAALFFCVACGGGAEADDPNSEVPPFQGIAPVLPAPPTLPAGSGGQANSPASPPPTGEVPNVGQDTPIVPPVVLTPPQQQPPTMPPPVIQPPVMQPPPPVDGNAPDPNFLVFLLIGQSNMEGVPPSEAQDRTPNPRVKVLAFRDCQQRGQVRNQWYDAAPSLHTCANTLGPGDYFGKAMADALPNATIGLVPDAIAGVDIDIFRKGVVSQRRGEWFLPPDNQRNSAYETVVERARLAQEVGVIRGILFHQGESDSGQATWLGKVEDMVADLRADLGLGNIPFLAGELLYPPGCCGGHNTLINQLPGMIPGAQVVSANGLGAFAGDGFGNLHFNVAGQREFGRRYAQVMLDALDL